MKTPLVLYGFLNGDPILVKKIQHLGFLNQAALGGSGIELGSKIFTQRSQTPKSKHSAQL